MSVMGFTKKFDRGVGGVSSIQYMFWIVGMCLTLQIPLACEKVNISSINMASYCRQQQTFHTYHLLIT